MSTLPLDLPPHIAMAVIAALVHRLGDEVKLTYEEVNAVRGHTLLATNDEANHAAVFSLKKGDHREP